MFHTEFYANRIAMLESEIKRKKMIASLIFSPSKLCQSRARAAIRRINVLHSQIASIEAAAAQEAAMDA